jgi:hypothetical protein
LEKHNSSVLEISSFLDWVEHVDFCSTYTDLHNLVSCATRCGYLRAEI